jgi:ribosomal protein S21
MTNLVVEVRDGDVESALSRMKKGLLKTGFFTELKRRSFYTPPGERCRFKSLRAQKAARKRASQYRVRLDVNGDPR